MAVTNLPVSHLPTNETTTMETPTVSGSPLVFLRVMAAIAWSAFRHPFTTTVIDLATGKVLAESGDGD